jgi:hypothetical protein
LLACGSSSSCWMSTSECPGAATLLPFVCSSAY